MYTGTMIEDLISIVARAEQQAHTVEVSAKPEPPVELVPMYPLLFETSHETMMVGVA